MSDSNWSKTSPKIFLEKFWKLTALAPFLDFSSFGWKFKLSEPKNTKLGEKLSSYEVFNPYQAGLFGQRIGGGGFRPPHISAYSCPDGHPNPTKHGLKWKLASSQINVNLETLKEFQKSSKKYRHSDLLQFSAFGDKNS